MVRKRIAIGRETEQETGRATYANPERVGLRGLSKIFPGGIKAVHEVTLQASAGEVHAILGENGAGKTTLMQMLAGILKPTAGIIERNGQQCRFNSPMDAKLHGIGMVHQHFSLVPALTVAENLAIGRVGHPFFLQPRQWNEHVREKAHTWGIDIRPEAPVWKLSIGEQQRVEIFRLLLDGARILILDEPTSILSPYEADGLFDHIRLFAKAGHIVFLVTHKIHHVREIAHSLSILRRGQLVASCQAAELDDNELADLMVGQHLGDRICQRATRELATEQQPALVVDRLSVAPRVCPTGLKNISFQINRGQILGIAGISGNGQDELVDAITGMSPYTGGVEYAHGDGTNGDSQIGYIPGDRRRLGLAMTMSLQENLVLRKYTCKPFSLAGLLRWKAIREYAVGKIAEYNIRPTDPGLTVSSLSGGNMQKTILARELDGDKAVIVAVNPTAGLDIATVRIVHAKLLERAAQGAAVLLVSEDLDELLQLCDNILVLRKGKIELSADVATLSKTRAGLAMSKGLPAEAEPDARGSIPASIDSVGLARRR